MGQIVGGFATSHVLFPPDKVEAQAERVLQGMLELRRRVRALKPDLIVLAGSDHLNNFSLALQVTLAVGVADSYTTLGDGGAPVATFPGHRRFAEDFARFAQGRDFELVQAEELRPDHGMAIPKLIVDPGDTIPIVPVYINCNMPVPPSPRRCFRLGGVLKEMVETVRPAGERVVVVGGGGLSHWLCLPEQGRVAVEFDEDFIAKMIGGRAEELAEYEAEDILRASGNGGLELTAWLFMAGALPGARGDKLYYEPVPQWISGMGGVALMPRESAKPS
jgi:aromatic ring-opening dioxygenase catalytic subunit (LigB family)